MNDEDEYKKTKIDRTDKQLIAIVANSPKSILQEISPENGFKLKPVNKLPLIMFCVMMGANSGFMTGFFKFSAEIY